MFAIVLGNPYEGKSGSFTSNLLKISVVGIGFGYPLSAIAELSASSFYFVIIFIVIAIVVGAFLTNLFAVDNKIGDMISSGTAICGASAIAAIGSSIRANEKQISIALGDQLAGIFTNNSLMAQQLIDAGHQVDEKVWRLPCDPIGERYDKYVDSTIADMHNVGKGGEASSTTAPSEGF